jgi:hypothetical protein
MVTKPKDCPQFCCPVRKPLKETEFDIENRAELFVIAPPDLLEASPINHCEEAFGIQEWNRK